MKKLNLIVAAVILFAACKSGAGKTAASDTANAVQNAIVNTGGVAVDTAKNMSGSNLIATSDCLTCHNINKHAFGPSYEQIANKYENNEGNVQNLADKIIKGGKGLWGQNAMTPHPTINQAQAQEMVRYILTLRNASGQ